MKTDITEKGESCNATLGTDTDFVNSFPVEHTKKENTRMKTQKTNRRGEEEDKLEERN